METALAIKGKMLSKCPIVSWMIRTKGKHFVKGRKLYDFHLSFGNLLF